MPAAAVTPAPVAHRPFVAVKVLVVKTEGEIRGNDVGVWRRRMGCSRFSPRPALPSDSRESCSSYGRTHVRGHYGVGGTPPLLIPVR